MQDVNDVPMVDENMTGNRNSEGMEVTDTQSENNDTIKIISTLQYDLLKDMLKPNVEGQPDMGPEIFQMVRKLGHILVVECCRNSANKAKQEGRHDDVELFNKYMDDIIKDLA